MLLDHFLGELLALAEGAGGKRADVGTVADSLGRRAGRAHPAAASPVERRQLRTCAGVSTGRPRALAMPWMQAMAPVTIGDALEVPLNVSVYQRSSFAAALQIAVAAAS